MSNTTPLGWEVSSLDQVFSEIKNGCSIDQNTSGDGIPVTRIETISQEKIDYSKVGWVKTTDDIDRFKIEKYDILLSHINSLKHIGKTAIKEDDRRLYHGMNLLRLKVCKSKFYPVYIHNLLSWEVVREEMRRKAKQAINQASLNVQDIKSLTYVLPPLPEQQKIATILSSVDDVIEKTRAQIDKLKDLKTGMMQELFTQGIGHTEFKNTPVGRIPETWKVKTLGDLIKSMDGGVSVNGENREKGLNEIGVLKVSSVFKGQFLPQEHKAVVPEDVSRVRLNPKKDHILFSRANTPLLVGESAYIDKDYHDLFLPDKLWMIDVKDRRQVNVKWLSYILCSEQVRSAITDAATGSSSTMKNISKPSLLGISTVLPPIFEQKKISDMLQSVDEKTIVTIQKLKNLTKIKKALMQDLLTGKVRVKLTDKESAAR